MNLIPIHEIQNVINYLYEDELKHYEEAKAENGEDVEHIFNSIDVVDEWLKGELK